MNPSTDVSVLLSTKEVFELVGAREGEAFQKDRVRLYLHPEDTLETEY